MLLCRCSLPHLLASGEPQSGELDIDRCSDVARVGAGQRRTRDKPTAPPSARGSKGVGRRRQPNSLEGEHD